MRYGIFRGMAPSLGPPEDFPARICLDRPFFGRSLLIPIVCSTGIRKIRPIKKPDALNARMPSDLRVMSR
jgi:hypothetical protein